MATPLPLPVWDRRANKLIDEFMDDHPATYESRPHRSITQWLESQPLYDWIIAAWQNTRRSARQIEPFIKKHQIDMAPFRPAIYRSFADFFDREFKPGARASRRRQAKWARSPKRAISRGSAWRQISDF